MGSNGIDKVREGDRKTPTGTYTLTGGFGIQPDPGAVMDYVQVNKYLYWCGDSAYYNTMVGCAGTSPYLLRGASDRLQGSV